MSALTEYLQKELAKGFSKNAVTDKLLKVGYRREKIEQAFAEIDKKESIISRASKRSTADKEAITRWAAVVVLILVIIAGTYLIVNKFMKPEEIKKEKLIDISKCNKLGDNEKDNCILEAAKEFDTGDVCNNIKESNRRVACTAKIWKKSPCLYLSLIEQNAEQCNLQEALQQKKPNKCYFTNNSTSCLLQLALQEDNILYCSVDIGCGVTFASEKDDITLCDQLNSDKYDCRTLFAIQKKNPTLCPKSGTDDDDYCITEASK